MRRNAYLSGKFPIKFISVKARVKETYVHGLFPVEFFIRLLSPTTNVLNFRK